MKPKNRVYCPACHRQKMLFDTEKEAKLFIKFNADEMKKKPKRAYYCPMCGGFHITSSEDGSFSEVRDKNVLEWIEKNEKNRKSQKAHRTKGEISMANAILKEAESKYDSLHKRVYSEPYDNSVSIKDFDELREYLEKIPKENQFLTKGEKKRIKGMIQFLELTKDFARRKGYITY